MAAQRDLPNSGVTLVEVLVAGAIGAVLVSAVFATASFLGTTTQELAVLEQLRIQAVYMNEYVSKWVELGTYVTQTGVPAVRPVAPDTFQTNDMTIQGIVVNGTVAPKRFAVLGNTLMEDGNPVLMPYGATLSVAPLAPLQPFAVVDDGVSRCSVDFTYRLNTRVGGRVRYFPLSTESMVCKNGSTY